MVRFLKETALNLSSPVVSRRGRWKKVNAISLHFLTQRKFEDTSSFVFPSFFFVIVAIFVYVVFAFDLVLFTTIFIIFVLSFPTLIF